MGTRQARRYYCRCGTRLAKDNTDHQCARCQRASRDKLLAPPQVPAEFWETEQFREAFAAQHMGRVARAYRTHPHHYAVYGPSGISQTLLGQWLTLRQPQISRFETGPTLQHLDTLRRGPRCCGYRPSCSGSTCQGRNAHAQPSNPRPPLWRCPGRTGQLGYRLGHRCPVHPRTRTGRTTSTIPSMILS